MRNKQKGFSLIELLIVVAIILIIAAIAIPNLIRSRMAANEASAVATLRTLTTAFISYSTTYGNGLPPNLTALQNPALATTPADCNNAGLVDATLAGLGAGGGPLKFTKNGYNFTYIPVGAALTSSPNLTPACTAPGYSQVQVSALPMSVGGTGQRGFLVDNSGVITFTTNGTLPAAGAPVL
jgi:type IV pilus assembly protein PilA